MPVAFAENKYWQSMCLNTQLAPVPQIMCDNENHGIEYPKNFQEATIAPNDDLEILMEITPVRPVIQKAWEWANSRLSEDQTLPREAVSPAALGSLTTHASLSEAVFEGEKLVDFKFSVLSRVMADYMGEKTGKMGSDSLSPAMLERGLVTGQHVLTHQKPCIIRASLLAKQHRRLEHLYLPVRLNGEVKQILAFTDIWFPGVT